mmetsp:Transcript_62556/g.174797  ORF Transcript_62556/g.174797 Transcript_62556/m.174797 type:complete len:224 (+) Transcript_62556:1715-2386(+)
MTQASLWKCGSLKGRSADMRSACSKLPRTSMMTTFRRCVEAAARRDRFALPSSSAGMPRFMSGRSLQRRTTEGLGRQTPLLTAQSMIFLSETSAKSGFCERNQSHQWNVPASGMHTGNNTLCFPSASSWLGVTSTSSRAASWSMRHLKGKVVKGVGPKLTCTDTFLNVMVGYNVFPFNASGNGCGSAIRTPSLKSVMVIAFGLPSWRLITSATTQSVLNFWET